MTHPEYLSSRFHFLHHLDTILYRRRHWLFAKDMIPLSTESTDKLGVHLIHYADEDRIGYPTFSMEVFPVRELHLGWDSTQSALSRTVEERPTDEPRKRLSS